MKLNPDCIRDVLLYLEENLLLNLQNKDFEYITLKQIQEHFNARYLAEDVWYTVYNLHQIHFIEGNIADAGGKKMFFCDIKYITWAGHQFLNNIRPTSVWDATKSKAKQIGGLSIQSLSLISSTIIQSIASHPDFIQSIIDKIPK